MSEDSRVTRTSYEGPERRHADTSTTTETDYESAPRVNGKRIHWFQRRFLRTVTTRFAVLATGTSLRSIFVPKLWHSHRGYALIAVKLVSVHIGLGLITLLASQHGSPVYEVVYRILPGALWSAMHLAIGVLAIVGLYWRFVLARAAWLLSLIVFNAFGISLLVTGIEAINDGSPGWVAGSCFTLALLCIGESGDSYAALHEPEINPASAR